MRIKKTLFWLFIFSTALSLNAQSKRETAENRKNNAVEIGYVETYEKLPKLKFEKISQTEFDKYKSEKYLVVPKLEQNKDYFYLQTAKQKHKFRKYKFDATSKNKNGSMFLGFYPKLDLLAVTNHSVSEGLEFGEMSLIDKKTDYTYKIISIGDWNVETPIPSKNEKYLVYYYNYVYQHKNSFIGVLKIDKKSHPKKFLQEYASFESKDFAVEEIIWVNDNSFVLKGFEEVFENQKWIKKFNYYKTDFQ